MKWSSDKEAYKYLYRRGFKQKDGVWQIPKSRKQTKVERSAFDYLFFEWDWGTELVDTLDKAK